MAGLAVVLAVLLAPDTLVLVGLGLAGILLTGPAGAGRPTQPRLAAAAGLLAGAVAVRLLLPAWSPQSEDPARWAAGPAERWAAGAVLLVVALLAAWSLPRFRGLATGLAGTTVLAGVPPSGRLPALLLCLPVAAVLVGGLVERATRSPAGRHGSSWAAGRLVAAVAVAAGVVLAAVAYRTTPRSDFGAATYDALAAWAADQLLPDARLAGGAGLSAELVHAGVDPQLVVPDSGGPRPAALALVVLRVQRGGPPAASAPVARFDAADHLRRWRSSTRTRSHRPRRSATTAACSARRWPPTPRSLPTRRSGHAWPTATWTPVCCPCWPASGPSPASRWTACPSCPPRVAGRWCGRRYSPASAGSRCCPTRR